MLKTKVLVLDFDGVIIDGMQEYWSTCCKACENIIDIKENIFNSKLYAQVPQEFIELRPLVNKGWEMLLITYEIIKQKNDLCRIDTYKFKKFYSEKCLEILKNNDFEENFLQNLLDSTREKLIDENYESWLSKHNVFQEVVELVNNLKRNNVESIILSTKNSQFTRSISDYLGIDPFMIFGHESGSKIDILKTLHNKYEIIGFIEDRKLTLELVKKTYETKDIPCFLADWGYVKEEDRLHTNNEISIITLQMLTTPLASWN